jgi:hypothetical protein
MRALSETSFHALWISTGVRAGEYDYSFGGDTIPKQIRESTNNCPANVAMHKLIDERRPGESIDYPRDFRTELSAQSGLLCFVPDLRLSNIQLRRDVLGLRNSTG